MLQLQPAGGFAEGCFPRLQRLKASDPAVEATLTQGAAKPFKTSLDPSRTIVKEPQTWQMITSALTAKSCDACAVTKHASDRVALPSEGSLLPA